MFSTSCHRAFQWQEFGITNFWTRLLLALTCVSVIGAAWLIHSWAARPSCISSKSISKISFVRNIDGFQQLSYIPICGRGILKSDSVGDFFFSQVLQQTLSKDIIGFEQLSAAMNLPISDIELVVLADDKLRATVTSRQIILGIQVIEAEGMLLKALNSAWLLQLNATLSGNPVMLEVLSDILVAVDEGGLKLRQPTTGKIASFVELSEDFVLMSQMELCESAWVPMSQLAFCESLIRIKVSKDNLTGPVAAAALRMGEIRSQYSLRSHLGRGIWHRYKAKGIAQRVPALVLFLSELQSADFLKQRVPAQPERWLTFSQVQLEKFFF